MRLLESVALIFYFFFLMIRPPRISPPFPSPALFGPPVPQLAGDRHDVGGERLDAVLRRVVRAGGLELAALVDRHRPQDRKSTRLNSSHANISYAVFCLKKKKKIYLRFQDYTLEPLLH